MSQQVWCVRYSNYDPPEVDSLWINEELARRRAKKLNELSGDGMWTAEAWGHIQDETSELL